MFASVRQYDSIAATGRGLSPHSVRSDAVRYMLSELLLSFLHETQDQSLGHHHTQEHRQRINRGVCNGGGIAAG